MIRSLIVDDEPLARERLRHLARDHGDLEVIGECANGLEAVAAIEALAPDLVFLDIQMPELDGFGVIEAVGAGRMPAVLFVTSYAEFALKAFELHALDYLLKPYDSERFNAALARVRVWIRGQAKPDLEPLLRQVQVARPAEDRLLVKDGSRYTFIKLNGIQWLEAEDNYVRVHLESRSHLVRQTLAGMLEKLDPTHFRRIHRSAIVNLDCILHLEPWTGGDHLVTMRDGTQLTLSRTFRGQLGEWL